MRGWALFSVGALALAGCDLHDALFGFRPPTISVAGTAPPEMTYREALGGLVILTARVNDTADVDFILDTGAPLTVLLDDRQTAALRLDTSGSKPLGDPKDPATPVGARAFPPTRCARTPYRCSTAARSGTTPSKVAALSSTTSSKRLGVSA